jgi:hypothetical protein
MGGRERRFVVRDCDILLRLTLDEFNKASGAFSARRELGV